MGFALVAVAIGLLALSSASAAGVEERNGLIALARQNAGLQDQIFVMRPDGKVQHALTRGAPGAREPAWSPDGKEIAFTDGHERLAVMNADGSGARILTHESGDSGDGSAQWSPDGKRLVFEVNHGFGKKEYLTTIGADGKGKHRLRAGFDPDWSPNGKLIVFSDVGGRIATVRADGRGLHRLTHTGCADKPRWSPDGKKIVFLVATGCYDPPRIAVMRANGKALRKITAKREQPRWIGLVDWSPDGRKIVFSAGRQSPVVGNIYVMDPHGSHRQQLTSSGDAFDPSWQPA